MLEFLTNHIAQLATIMAIITPIVGFLIWVNRRVRIEQSRWDQSNIDTLFYAGIQSYVNRYFNFSPSTSFPQYHFNLIQPYIESGEIRKEMKEESKFAHEEMKAMNVRTDHLYQIMMETLRKSQ